MPTSVSSSLNLRSALHASNDGAEIRRLSEATSRSRRRPAISSAPEVGRIALPSRTKSGSPNYPRSRARTLLIEGRVVFEHLRSARQVVLPQDDIQHPEIAQTGINTILSCHDCHSNNEMDWITVED